MDTQTLYRAGYVGLRHWMDCVLDVMNGKQQRGEMMIKVGVKRDINAGTFRGVVKVYDKGRYMYSSTLLIHRLCKIDALRDAHRAAQEAIDSGHLSDTYSTI